MPIKIPDSLPARAELEREGMIVMSERDAIRQDIRPLRIAMLNLMPRKQTTETQLARLIGGTPLQIDFTLVTTSSYTPTNVSPRHMRDFYRPWSDVARERFDAFIITGAPIEQMPFEEVYYWDELRQILDWTQTHVHHTLNLCWGGQASLYHFHGVPKHQLPTKRFGVFEHNLCANGHPLLRGFDDSFPVPVSRHTETRREDIEEVDGLTVLADSPEAGLCLVHDKVHRQINMFNHLEYDSTTLSDEYHRDLEQGLDIGLPAHYYPDDDPTKMPRNTWRAHAHLMISNWVNLIYQTAPFDIARIGDAGREPAALMVEGAE